MNLEEFLEYLKKEYPSTEFPDKITRENINTFGIQDTTFMEYALWKKDAHKSVLSKLLDMGAFISDDYLAISHENNRLYLLQNCDTKQFSIESLGVYGWSLEELYLAIDYGINLPQKRIFIGPGVDVTKCLQCYFECVSSRISTSRKALAALIICCKRGFYPLRDVGVALAREMWGARGPGGCGPRAHTWSKGKGE